MSSTVLHRDTEPAREPETSAPALALLGLHKRFGETVAVEDVTLTVPAGSMYGLVGPNGAGKTTALPMAVGLLRPDAGRATMFGVDVWANPTEAKATVGVLPDDMALPERLTGPELLTYLGLLRGLDKSAVASRTEELLSVLGLASAASTLVVDYSAGMRKKITLATALLHAPRLLVLDEPFEAVDPLSAATIKGILRRFVAAGGSVVLSSHVMPLVEELCDHVAIVAGGRVAAAGTLADVRGGRPLEERFVELAGTSEPESGDLSWLASS